MKPYKEPIHIIRQSKPIVTINDIPHPCVRVTNATAVKFGDEYIVAYKVIETENLKQYIGMARSKDGYNFTVDPLPMLEPDEEDQGRANDPRLTKHEDGWYYLTYCSDPHVNQLKNIGRHPRGEGIYLCIARTRDFKTWERIYRSEPDNRNAVIFPEKIEGLYVRLDRPFTRGYRKEERGHDIWISYSPDMRFWGKHKLVLSFLDVEWAKTYRIGPGCPPIKTEYGWLTIFHGAEYVYDPDGENFLPWLNGYGRGVPGPTQVYRAGVMLLDLKDPSKIIGRYKDPIMEVTTDYEKDPTFRPNVIFPGGAIVEPDGEVKIYYGAADTSVAVATAKLNDLVDLCLKSEG